jgi:hypothetical protein
MADDEVTELHPIPPDTNAKDREMDGSVNEEKDFSFDDAPDEDATGKKLRSDTDPETVLKHLMELRNEETAQVKKAFSSESRSARASRPNLEEESSPEDDDEDDEDDKDERYKHKTEGIVSGLAGFEADSVLKFLYDSRRKEEMGQKKEAASKGRPKRSRLDNQDMEEDDEKEEDEDDRIIVYSSDVKDLVSDDHHETIEKVESIAYVMAEAKKYLGGFNGVKMAWSKNKVVSNRFVCLF